jgi:hypothetical protein
MGSHDARPWGSNLSVAKYLQLPNIQQGKTFEEATSAGLPGTGFFVDVQSALPLREAANLVMYLPLSAFGQTSVLRRSLMAKATKSGSTGATVASAAAKVLQDKTATKEEKAVAASALTQKGSNETTSAKVATSAAKVLRSKTASKDAKAAAASALTQKKR